MPFKWFLPWHSTNKKSQAYQIIIKILGKNKIKILLIFNDILRTMDQVAHPTWPFFLSPYFLSFIILYKHYYLISDNIVLQSLTTKLLMSSDTWHHPWRSSDHSFFEDDADVDLLICNQKFYLSLPSPLFWSPFLSFPL